MSSRKARMRVHTNIKLSEEARDLLVENYPGPDGQDLDEIETLPCLVYVSDRRDKAGNRIPDARLGYTLFRYHRRSFHRTRIFPFDGGSKFFAVVFRERFDEKASYLLEYFDGVLFLLKEHDPDMTWLTRLRG